MSTTTPAQSAGLKRCKTIFYQQKQSRSGEGRTARQYDAYFAAEVDALLQRQATQADGDLKLLWKKKEELAEKDRQIAELVAALKSERKSSARWAEMAGTFRGQYHDSCNQIAELVAALKSVNDLDWIPAPARKRIAATLAQHATPQSDTTATDGNDDAVIDWRNCQAIWVRETPWQELTEDQRETWRACNPRIGKGSES